MLHQPRIYGEDQIPGAVEGEPQGEPAAVPRRRLTAGLVLSTAARRWGKGMRMDGSCPHWHSYRSGGVWQAALYRAVFYLGFTIIGFLIGGFFLAYLVHVVMCFGIAAYIAAYVQVGSRPALASTVV